MTYLVGLVSFTVGLLLASCMWGLAWVRLVRRLTDRGMLIATAHDLENRRVAYDSGREHRVRATAGRPARISDGMATRPGALTRRRAVTQPGTGA